MATYYVKNGGNDLSAGTSAATAWATVAKALGASGISSGDTVYIAPGIYTEQITIGMTSATATTSIIGNPTGSLFAGVNPAPVIITNLNATLSANSYTGTVITSSAKNFLDWQNISFKTNANSLIIATSTRNWSFSKCIFTSVRNSGGLVSITAPTSLSLNLTVSDCIFMGANSHLSISGNNVSDTTSIQTSVFLVAGDYCIVATSVGGYVSNCTFIGCANRAINLSSGSLTFPLYVQNSLFMATYSIDLFCSGVANAIIENYNRLLGPVPRSNVATGANSVTTGDIGFDVGESLLYGLNNLQVFTSAETTPNKSFGIATNAPAADMYDVAWTGTSPDAGSGTYRIITSNPTNIGYSGGIERNASAITIAPASTSQSIELYLGATGLTFSTSGLAAYYVRNQSAPVAITLVTQTPTGTWASGGFAEISSSLVPGVYRLDVPNAAFIAGASDVTIVVRGASGTNGAVLTVTLSSGGLTAAQTAAAVWDEARASHTTAGTFGQYVNAELVTPVTSAALVRMGPFEVRADGLGASDPLDIQKGAQHGIDIQCVDNNGAGIDITSATVTAKVYNSGATLVDTYACTATYAADGRARFTIDTTVTNVPGTYTATITRTTGASDTQVFGPLRIYVRDI
jgi:hypothetical protein